MSYMDLLTGDAPAASQPSQSYMDLLTKGPELRAAPRDAKIPDTTVIQDSPATGARIGSTIAASMAPDVQGQIKILSRQMGVPENRFGVIGGDIVYQMDDGRLARAVPSMSGATGPMDAMRRAGSWLASQFGPSLPGLAAGVGGVATAPFAGGVPGAAAAAGATDVARQGIANAMIGRDVTEIDYANAAGHAALGGAGQGLAVGINRAMSRNPMQIAPYDRKQALDPATLAQAQAAQTQANGLNIPLSFGQTTGLRSALAAERQLARDPVSMDTMQRFYGAQRGAVRGAVDDMATRISPVASAEEGGRLLREGAGATLDKYLGDRSRAAAPLYNAVRTQFIPDQTLSALKGNRIVADALKSVRESGDYATEIGALPDNSMAVLDLVKRHLDDRISEAQRAGRNNQARLIANAREAMLGELDAAVPDYPVARSAFAARSPQIDALERGPVGALAQREGVETARDLSPMFDFRRIGPQAVAENRAAFEGAGQIDKWNAGLATYLRDQMASADGSPAKFINRVWGSEANTRERDVLKAAMTPVQWQGFRSLMQTLERVATTLPEGSPTATDMVGGQALRDQFGGAARAVGRMVSPQRALDIGGAVTDRIAVRLSDAGMAKLAEAVTDPNNVEALKKLRMMGPGTKAAAGLATQIMGGSLVGVFGGRTPDDFDPPALDAMRPNR